MIKVGSFSYGSTVSASAGINQNNYIKVTENKTNIFTPMLYGSGKNVLSFGYLDASASPKISGGGLSE